MASRHIEITGASSRYAASVRSLVDQTRNVTNEAAEALAIANMYIDLESLPDLTNNATYADLAVALGLVGTSANADAKKTYNLLVSAQARFVGTAITNFVDTLG